MGWWTRTSTLPKRDLRQIAYLLPMWGGIWSGVVFLWRRLICPQNGTLRMFWYRDLHSSHFFPRFGALEHEANRTPDISAIFIGSRKKFCERKRMSVCPAKNESRLFCLSPTGWIVSIGAVDEELRPFTCFGPKYGPHLVQSWRQPSHDPKNIRKSNHNKNRRKTEEKREKNFHLVLIKPLSWIDHKLNHFFGV